MTPNFDENLRFIVECPHDEPTQWWQVIWSTWDHDVGTEFDACEIMDEWSTDSEYQLSLSTGGWSQNEAVIEAMANNFLLWARYWRSSHRGGRTVFSDAHPHCYDGCKHPDTYKGKAYDT